MNLQPTELGKRLAILDMVFLQYEFSCVSLSYLTERKIVHSFSRKMASCQSDSVCVSSVFRTGRKTLHKHSKRSVSLQYGFFHVSSVG